MASLLARAPRPLTVKQIVAAVPVGQSTVSEHLRQLAPVEDFWRSWFRLMQQQIPR